MSTDTTHSTAAPRTARKFGVYHRTSNWFGAPHHATIITVDSGTVTAVTADGTRLMYAPARELTCRFSLWATITLEQGAARYGFVTGSYAGRRARPFTEAQKRELAEAGVGEPDDASEFNGVILSSPMGVATMFSEQHRAFLQSLQLAELIDAAGASTTYGTKRYATSAWITAAITLPALAVATAAIVGIAYLISEGF